MGAVERPIMEYSFRTADGTISCIVKPTTHANNFEIKLAIIQIIRDDAVRFRIFPFSLCDSTKDWFQSLATVRQESLYDACERFRNMLRRCPHHEVPVWLQVQTINNGATLVNRATIDAAADGTIMKKLVLEAFNIIDEIATNLYSIRTPTHTIRDGVVIQIFCGVIINSKDH
ncbi:UNVERIFIED_CONTAM: hypothetical protein Sindi_2281600 [Sesamum indicum]